MATHPQNPVISTVSGMQMPPPYYQPSAPSYGQAVPMPVPAPNINQPPPQVVYVVQKEQKSDEPGDVTK